MIIVAVESFEHIVCGILQKGITIIQTIVNLQFAIMICAEETVETDEWIGIY